MPRRAPTLLLAAVLALCCSALCGVASAGALSFVPCAGASAAGFECTTVPVPVSRTGLAAGTLSLSLERKQAGPTQSRTAVVALAGGPGQAALPLGEFIAKALAPALGTRDLLVFDQRGTGTSDPLSCGALSSFGGGSASQAFERCALEIGPARGGYTTQESVEDIEAIRQAAGYEKLVLYGTSYGTKVAEEYAERYPAARRSAGARLGRAAERAGTVLAPHLPGDLLGARRAVLEQRLRGDHDQPRGRHRDA